MSINTSEIKALVNGKLAGGVINDAMGGLVRG